MTTPKKPLNEWTDDQLRKRLDQLERKGEALYTREQRIEAAERKELDAFYVEQEKRNRALYEAIAEEEDAIGDESQAIYDVLEERDRLAREAARVNDLTQLTTAQLLAELQRRSC